MEGVASERMLACSVCGHKIRRGQWDGHWRKYHLNIMGYIPEYPGVEALHWLELDRKVR